MKNRKYKYIAAAVFAAAFSCLAVWAVVSLLKHEEAQPAPVAKVIKPAKAKPKPRKKARPDSMLVTGLVTDEKGRPLSGIVISDSYSCVRTDRRGRYRLRRDRKARFVYYTVPSWCEVPVHSATDRTANAYQRIEQKRQRYDFTLRRLPGGKEKKYIMIVIGDPQVTNAQSPYYTDATDNPVKKSDVQRFTDETMTDIKSTIASLPAGTAVYGLSMGDDVQYYGGYNPRLEMQLRTAIGSSDMRIFSVIGNHDQDGKEKYRRKWEDCWGPTDYSFDRGDEHYVCFNNVHFAHGSYWQPGELTDAQMRWLRQDLRLADRRKKVVLCYHIPLTFGNRPKSGATAVDIATEQGHYESSRLAQILKLLKRFKGGYELFCGHTHFAINHEVDFGGQHITEHCHAAACGNIWQSNINICGTPNGYYVYRFDSTSVADCYYKGTFWPRARQMSIFHADTDFNGESYSADWNIRRGAGAVVANVFNADSRWHVVAIEGDAEHDMSRISSKGQDAFAAGYHHKYSQSVSYGFISKRNGYLIMNHLYYYVPQAPGAPVTIIAYDPYGNIYTAFSSEAVTEPFFNYAHYYKRNSRLGEEKTVEKTAVRSADSIRSVRKR